MYGFSKRSGWRRWSIAAGAALIAVGSLAACSGTGGGDATPPSTASSSETTSPDQMDALIAAAKKEGSITFYGTPEEAKVTAWVKDFTDQYGITVNIYRAPSVDVYQRFSQEESAGRHEADLVTLSVPNYITDATNKGWALDYTPQTADTFKKDFVGEGRAFPLYVTTHAIAWNTDKVSSADSKAIIKDPYKAMLDPKYKGHIALVTAAAGGGQMSTYYNIVNNPDLGQDYLEKLAKQDPIVVTSAVTMASDLAAGEYWIAFPSSDTTVWPQIQDGAPLEFSYTPNADSSTHQMFISANAPHPNAARLFMEWATSAKAQTSIANISGGAVATSLWKDDRELIKEPWYKAPDQLSMEWATDPGFTNGVEELTNNWLTTFGQQ